MNTIRCVSKFVMNKLIVLWYSKMIHYWNSSPEYCEDLYFSLLQYQNILNIECGLCNIFSFITKMFLHWFGKKNSSARMISLTNISLINKRNTNFFFPEDNDI